MSGTRTIVTDSKSTLIKAVRSCLKVVTAVSNVKVWILNYIAELHRKSYAISSFWQNKGFSLVQQA